MIGKKFCCYVISTIVILLEACLVDESDEVNVFDETYNQILSYLLVQDHVVIMFLLVLSRYHRVDHPRTGVDHRLLTELHVLTEQILETFRWGDVSCHL